MSVNIIWFNVKKPTNTRYLRRVDSYLKKFDTYKNSQLVALRSAIRRLFKDRGI